MHTLTTETKLQYPQPQKQMFYKETTRKNKEKLSKKKKNCKQNTKQ